MFIEYCNLAFDTNYISLGLLGAKIHVIFLLFCLNFFRNFPLNSKGKVNIHKTKNKFLIYCKTGWYNIARDIVFWSMLLLVYE